MFGDSPKAISMRPAQGLRVIQVQYVQSKRYLWAYIHGRDCGLRPCLPEHNTLRLLPKTLRRTLGHANGWQQCRSVVYSMCCASADRSRPALSPLSAMLHVFRFR